jgi:hypothetical protein
MDELRSRISEVQLKDIREKQEAINQARHQLSLELFDLITSNVNSLDVLDEVAHMLWSHVEVVRENAKRQ